MSGKHIKVLQQFVGTVRKSFRNARPTWLADVNAINAVELFVQWQHDCVYKASLLSENKQLDHVAITTGCKRVKYVKL